ncbi:hypothetical protein D3877_07230 [Azospirillum cavernae]|uniref:HEPN AbiJ-N-terminal domain-containing protein n=1 Tax=Azospirillum cavernae TaxID=2320860 RepID=A0A418W2T2_9PROT|nr:hypothetical protein [Azospirillum cavernae]RJF84345.1 hypothetical protein D3877_07230 [Azospirillum cavernae]
MASSFSRRFGYQGVPAEITVREDAPEVLREGIVMLADHLGLSPHSARSKVCGILLRRPDPGNWSAYPNVADEVQELVWQAPWYRVYDIAEGFYESLSENDPESGRQFENRLNEFFRENGIGWAMENGLIIARGSEIFAESSKSASMLMASTGRQTAAQEMHEALADLSRRPEADITGAVQHSMAALECVARDVLNQPTKTLGQLVSSLNLPKPLDAGLEKLWGFASEQGRHLREGRTPRFEDAELVVTVASAISVYLMRGASDQ